MKYVKAKVSTAVSPVVKSMVTSDSDLTSNNIVLGDGAKKIKPSNVNIEDVATKEYVEEFGGKIDSISIDGVEQEIDENKNVDLPAYPTKSSLGLDNVDNTSDLNKPISTATQTALNAKQETLVSGTNIKTINNESLLGSGNIANVVQDSSYVHTDNNFTSSLKDKLDGIESQANKTIVDNTLDSSSTNPVQNKLITEALGNKVDKETGKGLSTNDFTTEYKNAVNANTAKISNVQANWNAESGLAQILNKPSIYTQSEINDFLELTVDENDIDQEHSTGGLIVIIPETAEKIKSFKYRLKFKTQLVIPSANPEDYFLFSPSNVVTNVDTSWMFENPSDCYSFIAGQGGIFDPGRFQTLMFFDVYNLNVFVVGNITDDLIPVTLMSSTESGHSVMCLGNGDGASIGANIPFQEPLVSGSNIKSVDGQSLLGSGNIQTTDNNQTIKSGDVTFGANDVVEIVGGTNVTIAESAVNKTITISAQDTTYNAVSDGSGSSGLLKRNTDTTVSAQSQSTKFLREDGKWAAPSYTTDHNQTVKVGNETFDADESVNITGLNYIVTSANLNNNSIAIGMTSSTGASTNAPKGDVLTADGGGGVVWDAPQKIKYETSAPSDPNTDGGLKFVVLSSEPANKYSGYIYIITGSQS